MRILILLTISGFCFLPLIARAVWISHNDFYEKPESKMYVNFLFPLYAIGLVSTVAAFYYLIRDERLKQSKRE
jgi:hypothetical protein